MKAVRRRTHAVILWCAAGMAGCGSAPGQRHAYHLGNPQVMQRGSLGLALAVQDWRPDVGTGAKRSTFVGQSRGNFGKRIRRQDRQRRVAVRGFRELDPTRAENGRLQRARRWTSAIARYSRRFASSCSAPARSGGWRCRSSSGEANLNTGTVRLRLALAVFDAAGQETPGGGEGPTPATALQPIRRAPPRPYPTPTRGSWRSCSTLRRSAARLPRRRRSKVLLNV